MDNETNFMELLANDKKKLYIDTLTQMKNQFELSFDYIPKETNLYMDKYITKLKNDQTFFETEINGLIDVLIPFSESINKLANTTTKTSKSQYAFLNTIVLFEGSFPLKMFESENKNTKKTIVNYLHTLHSIAYLLSIVYKGDSFESLTEEVAKIIAKQHHNDVVEIDMSNSNSQPKTDDIFSILMNNPDVTNMATELSKELEEQQIDPMTLMASLLNGQPNAQLNGIVGSLTTKIEEKISSGQIDKQALEQQATSMMNALSKTDIVSMLKKTE